MMFRLTFLLCAGLFLAMLIGGQDRGQQRFGLMSATGAEVEKLAAAAPEAAPAPMVAAAAFVPEKPVMVQPATVVAPAPAPSAVVSPEPAIEGRIVYVAAASANVREGPGKAHAVIERLSQGEAVLVVAEGEGPEGWSLIRIEGDGVEGYVASRLLTE